MGVVRNPGPVVAVEPAALPPGQRRVYEAVRRLIAAGGYPPTLREIGAACGIVTTNGVACHLRALTKKGLISRTEAPRGRGARCRAITVPGLNDGGFSLPLFGAVAAGPPLEAHGSAERLDLKAMFGDEGSRAVRVGDDAFLPAGIARGDYAVVRPAGPGDDNKTVVAVGDGGRLGLYTPLRSRRGGVRLDPRPGSPPPGDAPRVLGVLSGVLRAL